MALFIQDLTLARFRSHTRARISAGPRPMAIFGPNGAGKTNLLEAVSLLSPGRGMRRASAADVTQRGAPGWSIRATLQSTDRPRDLALRSKDGAARSLRIDDKSETQAALGRLARVLWLVPAMDRLWIEGAEGRRRFLDRLTLSFTPSHADAVLAYEKAMRERNRLLRDQVR
ncbi:MAG: AAA family ATPase, partial [Primorskyibacter sp.]